MQIVPVQNKLALTVREAAEYSNIGINKLESLLRTPRCPFVLYVGKKKLVIAGFLGLAVCYAIAAVSSIEGICDGGVISWIFGGAIMVISALPMALLGIIPQSIIADVAEAESVTTGENRQGMFFAARTFAMKFGQSIAMLAFTSLAIIGAAQDLTSNDITPSITGLMIVAIVAIVFCVLGAVILLSYREKKIMSIIAKKEDAAFFKEDAFKGEKEEQ